MWHSTIPMPGQPGLFLLHPEGAVEVSEIMSAGNSYTVLQNGAQLTIPMSNVSAVHALIQAFPNCECVFSLGSRYSLRMLSRPASARTLNSTLRNFEWLFQLRDNASVLASAVCSTIPTSEISDDIVVGAFSGLSVCVGYCFRPDGVPLMYFHAAGHMRPSFHGPSAVASVVSFGATTCSLTCPVDMADATAGDSRISFPAVGSVSSNSYARVLCVSCRTDPFVSSESNVPDQIADKQQRAGSYPASLRSRALNFRSFANSQFQQGTKPILADSAGHCEVAITPGFVCASNALPGRDLAFVPPNVAWRSNLSPSHQTNLRLSKLEIKTPRWFSGFFFQASFLAPFSGILPPANVIYSSDSRLAVGQMIVGQSFQAETYITAINGPFSFGQGLGQGVVSSEVTLSKAIVGFRSSGAFQTLALSPQQETVVVDCTQRGNNEYHYESGQHWAAAEIALQEVMQGSSLPSATLSDVFTVRVYTTLAIGSGDSQGVLTQQQAAALLAGQEVTLPKPNFVLWESGHIIKAVGT